MNERSKFLASAAAAAILFSIGYVIVVLVPGGGTMTDETFTDFYASNDNVFQAFLLLLATVASAWALVWFFSELRARLTDHVLTRTAYAIALVAAGALAIGAAILFAPGGVQQNSEGDFVGIEIAHTFAQAGLGVMLFVGMYSFALAIVLFSFALRRDGLVPSWFPILGVVFGVLMLGSFVWAPGYLLPIWIVLVAALTRVRERVPV